jgi:hypothetical protein
VGLAGCALIYPRYEYTDAPRRLNETLGIQGVASVTFCTLDVCKYCTVTVAKGMRVSRAPKISSLPSATTAWCQSLGHARNCLLALPDFKKSDWLGSIAVYCIVAVEVPIVTYRGENSGVITSKSVSIQPSPRREEELCRSTIL